MKSAYFRFYDATILFIVSRYGIFHRNQNVMLVKYIVDSFSFHSKEEDKKKPSHILSVMVAVLMATKATTATTANDMTQKYVAHSSIV